MSQEIKYTTDGKKVIVVGNLNSQEKIVQEIFMVNGNEIPSGENFVVKSLHDAPAISWKESKLKELESRYEKDKKYWDFKIENLNRDKRIVYDSLSARVKWLRNIAKEPREAELKKVINQIADFLSDSEKWVFVRDYTAWHLQQFNENGVNSLFDRYESSYGSKRFDSMRLLSLFGRSDGSLVFRINDYSDGSGSDKDVVFFKSKEEALTFIQQEFEQIKKYSSYDLENAKKFDLKIDQEKLNVYNESKKASIEKQVKELEDRLIILNKDLNNIK
ncbi:hypothetical protein PFY12_14650 [Chryseobacterium camelliae]|uniref:Uncharacterized protein n=1 Tax=Chryseobacterium camelliae TaxID=1265445 RepID=A0ABY7QKV8_9FLAO|nr:hypothetical protein [Chryseobacterium camelliae]WBV60265.1 hypothetical protein PFY12_14650 [Chryseobacterium camelliae]